MEVGLSILFGACVGFALGLTGGGGSLLAVPLLVYGLSVPPRDAFGISLAAVGATALIGVIPRIRDQRVEVGTGIWFAVAGMVGRAVGNVGCRTNSRAGPADAVCPVDALCRRKDVAADADSRARRPAPSSPAAGVPTHAGRPASADISLRDGPRLAGLVTGFLSGMFGVGGGFVIVPALVLFSGMPIHRAIATSLLVIVLVSVSGVASHLAAGRNISLSLTALFVVGGMLGMTLGGHAAKRLSGPMLQKVFAAGIVAVAVFVVVRTLA